MPRSDISPELVLVDPDLAQLARAALGPPGELPPHARGFVPSHEPRVAPDPPLIARVPSRPGLAPSEVEPEPAAAAAVAARPRARPSASVPVAIMATAPRSPEPLPVGGAASRVGEPVARRRRRSFVPTLVAASLALNAALAWEIIGSAGSGPQLRAVDAPTAAEARSEPAPKRAVASPRKAQQSSTPKQAQAAKISRPKTRDSTKHRASTQQQQQQQQQQPLARQAKARAVPGSKREKAVRPSLPTKHPKAATDGEPTSVALSWDAAEGATFYNVVLWRDSTRLLDLWPTAPNVRIPNTWTYRGKHRRLEPGRYLWFAFAGYGAGDDRRVGPRVASGDVVVEPQ